MLFLLLLDTGIPGVCGCGEGGRSSLGLCRFWIPGFLGRAEEVGQILFVAAFVYRDSWGGCGEEIKKPSLGLCSTLLTQPWRQ